MHPLNINVPRIATLWSSCESITTPSFVYDEAIIARLLGYANKLRANESCKVLFAIKSFSVADGLRLMVPPLDGFAVSSLFEARLAREVLGSSGTIHFTSPGIRPGDAEEIGSICDYVTFNSLSQWDLYHERIGFFASCGLRLNPQVSFVDDARYDPCRPHSKLGVPTADVLARVTRDNDQIAGLEGLHIHSNCDSTNCEEARATVEVLRRQLGDVLGQVEWINLGGGYLFDRSENIDALCESIDVLHSQYGLRVFIEPGAAFIRAAGSIVSTVLDVFSSDGKEVAVLDTTVNHMPEVFEYEESPVIFGHNDNSPYEYILAGCTCLAGDLFGTYRFDDPLRVGSKIVFQDVGAYTLPKAHMFNGVNLPDIYALTEAGELNLKKRFTYADYADKWGVDVHVSD